MYPGVINVEAKSNFKLIITFSNNEVKEFDMSDYLEIGNFKKLKDERIFKTARVVFDTVEWSNGLDIDPETLYNKAKTLN